MTLIRRAILAFALSTGLAPAFAQVPPPVPALPDTERRTAYSISASTCACAVGFALFGEGTDYGNWLEVWVNGVNVPQFGNWAVSSPTGSLGTIPRPVTDAVLTFNSAQTGTVQIVGARRPRRISQFSENRGVAARDLNQALTDIIAQNRETWDKTNDITGRAVMAPPGETLNILAAAATRANSVLGFDGVGQLGYYNRASQVTTSANVNFVQAGTGAVSRTVQSELRDAIKVTQFGAVCDGVTNDAAAVQAAITFADSIGNPPVALCPGSSRLNSTPFLNKWTTPGILSVPGITLRGYGKGVSTLDTAVANGYAIAVNPDWKAAFQAISGGTVIGTGGALGTFTYYVQITMNTPQGDEVFVTLPKSFAVTGPTGRIQLVLPATNTGYSFNIYVGTATQPANYATVSAANAVAVGGGQTVYIDAVGSAHAVPTNKIATNQQVSFSDFSITSTTAAAGASGILWFKVGYSNITNVNIKGLLGSGLVIPDYTGDADGSFVVTVDRSKFDTIAGWCVDASGLALELSNFTVTNSIFNLCGTLPANYVQPQNYGSSGFTVSSITISTTPVVTTSVPHTLQVNDQVYIRAAVFSTGTLADDWYRVCGTVAASTYQLCTTNGAFVDTSGFGVYTASSARSMLAFRPPTATTGSGGLRWMGLIGTFKNLGFTQNNNVSMYFTEAGASDNATIEAVDFENTYGKGLYAASISGGALINSECLTAASLGPTISCVQLGTGFAAGGVLNFKISNLKVRSDVAPAVGFEQFQNTNNTGSFSDTNRVSGVTWQTFDAAGQARFNGFTFDPIPGQVQFSVSAANTFKIVPTGYGATLPLHLKATGEWVPYRVPDAGVTFAPSTSAINTLYNVYVFNSAASTSPYALSFTVDTVTPVSNHGYYTQSTDASRLYVGQAKTDGSGNFQAANFQISQYPPAPLPGGVATLTAHGVMIGEGTAPPVASAAMTDGQELIGQTGSDPLPKTTSGDCTRAASGALTCTKTNNVSFGNYATISAGQLTNSIGADVLLNNAGNYFDGPTVAQGVTGTWFASGKVTLTGTSADAIFCKLWDGTSIIDSAETTIPTALIVSLPLSGPLTSPAANIKISCRDVSNTTGKILFNSTGNSKDSTLSAFRIQ